MTDDSATRTAAHATADLRSTMRARLRETDALLFCTDFDGTLADIDVDPDAPTIAAGNRTALETLRDHDRTHVAVISGRELADLRDRVGVSGIVYAGNHGLELDRNGDTTVHPVATKRKRELERIVADIEDELEDTECFVEDKSVSATVHYRTVPEREADVHDAVAAAVERVAPGGFDCSTGKEIVELAPAVPWDKGRVVSLLAADHENSLAVYIGDDTTDEAAFEALSAADIGIHIGLDGETAADYRLADPAAVETFLEWLSTTGLDALDTTEESENDG